MRFRRSQVRKVIGSGDALLRASDLEWAEPNDFKSANLVILVHGFTSHGIYLQELGNFLKKFGYQTFIFNYNSYRGIYKAAQNLKDLILRYDKHSEGRITQNGVFIIAHSFGGLVARCLALDQGPQQFIRGIAMLGTPNNGCFPNSRWLSYFIEYGEHLTDLMPDAANPACLSAKECIRADETSGDSFIDRMNSVWEKAGDCPPAITISGGKRFLAISGNSLKNWLANHRIQAMIGDEDNDGLVTEKSVDMQTAQMITPQHRYTHFHSYPYYFDLNHTNLTQNQTLALEIVDWFSSLDNT